MVDPIEGDRLNPGIFDAVIPTAVHVQRSETHTEQVEDVVIKAKPSLHLASGTSANLGLVMLA